MKKIAHTTGMTWPQTQLCISEDGHLLRSTMSNVGTWSQPTVPSLSVAWKDLNRAAEAGYKEGRQAWWELDEATEEDIRAIVEQLRPLAEEANRLHEGTREEWARGCDIWESLIEREFIFSVGV